MQILIPLVAVALATAITNAIPGLREHTPLLMMLGAVVITSLLAGFTASVVAALAAGVIAEASWLTVDVDHVAEHLIPLLLFELISVVFALLAAERASAYRRLKTSEHHHRTLIQLCPDPVLVACNGEWTMANPAAVALLGATDERELLGRPVLDSIAPSCRARVQQRIQNALSGGRNPSLELDWLTVDGTTVAVEATTVGLEGDGPMILVFAHDLRARKQRDAEMRRMNELLTTVIDSSPTAILTVDADKRVTLWNNAAERMFGWSRAEVLGREYPLIPESDSERRAALANFEQVCGQGVELTRELKRRTRDGGSIDVLVSGAVLKNDEGLPAGAVISAVDIRDRKHAERVLAESEERYRSLYAAMHEGVALLHPVFDGEGTLEDLQVLDVNPAFEQIAGIRAERALMRRASELFGADAGRLLEGYRPVVARQQSVRFDASLGRKRITVSAFPMGALRFAAVFEDLTERKQLEEQLLQAQKMEAVGQLAGGVAHDFNNLLTTILGYAEFAAERFPPGDAGREDINEIQKAGTAAAALTRKLLAFSRHQMLRPVVFDLNARLTDAHALVKPLVGEQIDVAFLPGGEPLYVTLDPGQVEQVLLNLVSNARDAMPEGGRITIATSLVTSGGGDVAGAALNPGRYAALDVTDTGCGMGPEVRARVFEPFFTTKEVGRGTGLGLATVYGIVKQSGGQIIVSSEPGQGSTFRLLFPIADSPGAMPGDEPSQPAKSRRPSRLLVVEDNAPLRELTVKTLTRYGYQVSSAEDAAEALSLLERSAQIDLLVTDLVLPGLNGAALARAVVSRNPSVRVLYTTGHARESEHTSQLIENAKVLQKPFTLSALVEHVQEALTA